MNILSVTGGGKNKNKRKIDHFYFYFIFPKVRVGSPVKHFIKNKRPKFTRYALAHVHNTCVVKTARLHDVLCTYVFAEFASVFPPSITYTRVFTMDEFEVLALILLIIMAGANILFCI